MTRADFTALPADGSGFHAVGRPPTHALRRRPEVELNGAWDVHLLTSQTEPVGDGHRWYLPDAQRK